MAEKYVAQKTEIFGAARDREMPAPIEMLHVSISHVGPGINELVHFYQVVLNMRVAFVFDYPNFQFISLTYDDENHRIGIACSHQEVSEEDARKAPQRACRLEHTTWKFRDFGDLIVTARRIHNELGIWPASARHGGSELTMDYLDPDGNRVELLAHSGSKAEILFSLYQQFNTPKDDIKYSDVYLNLDMEKVVALYEAGTPAARFLDKEFCRQMIAEGKL
jgi:catechol 2,3-dioxygenase-like lactoylglutathione lyase family enzyme